MEGCGGDLCIALVLSSPPSTLPDLSVPNRSRMKLPVLGALLFALLAPCATGQLPLPTGYALARDPFLGRAALQLVDVSGGNVLEIGPLAAESLAGLCFAPDGRLFAFDPATAELVELSALDGTERARTSLSIPAPGAGQPCGLAIQANGNAFVACGAPALLYEFQLQDPSRTKVRADFTGQVIGLDALGDSVLSFLKGPERGVLALHPTRSDLVPLVGPAQPDFTNGDLAFDVHGRLFALDEEGALLRVDPVDGSFTRSPFLVLDAAHGLAFRKSALCTYAIEDDGRGALLRIDLVSGRIDRFAASAPRHAIAIAMARNGAMFVLDDESDRILHLDPRTGITTELEQVLGFDIQGGGIAFDASENLWLADLSGTLYLVDSVRGSAEARGSLGRSIQALSFDGTQLLGLEGDQLLSIAPDMLSTIPIGSGLGGFGGSGAALAASPRGGLFGLNRNGFLFGASKLSGSGLSLARLAVSQPRGFLAAPCPAGLGSFALERADLALDRSDVDSEAQLQEVTAGAPRDRWSMRGTLPSAGLPADPTGATVRVLLNDMELALPAALDKRGKYRSPRGAIPDVSLQLDGQGKFDFRFEELDLEYLIPFADGDSRLPLVIEAVIEVENAGLAQPMTRLRILLDATTRRGIDLRARLADTGNNWSGALLVETSKAKEIVEFSHRMRLRGTLAAPGGSMLDLIDDPRTERDLRITIGNAAAIEISFDELKRNGSKLLYRDRRRGLIGGLREFELDLKQGRFQVLSYPLADTGLPVAEAGSDTEVNLPFSIQFLSSSGPQFFAADLDLRRAKDTSKDWNRGAR